MNSKINVRDFRDLYSLNDENLYKINEFLPPFHLDKSSGWYNVVRIS